MSDEILDVSNPFFDYSADVVEEVLSAIMGVNTIPPISEFSEVRFPDYENTIARMTTPPLVANDVDTTTKEGQEKLQSILYTRFQGDSITPMPMCSCGKLTGGMNQGIRCNVCYTECESQLERPIESNLWIRALPGIDKFITPGFYQVLSPAITATGFNLLDWLISPEFDDPPANNYYYAVVERLELSPDQRNLNFFYVNFEAIMYNVLLGMLLKKKPRNVTGMSNDDVNALYVGLREGEVDPYFLLLETPLGNKLEREKVLAAFLKKMIANKNRVFSSYLPMPSSAGMVLETNSSGTWFDKVMLIAVDAMYAITSIDKTIQDKSMKLKNSKMVYCIKKMAEFSSEYIRKRIMGKKGLMRSHYYGGRQPFTMRCVIGPIIGAHKRWELHLPWSPSVQMFRLHITNKLLRRGQHPKYGRWTPKSISNFIDAYTNRYHPLLDEIMQELIDETKGKCIRVLYNRPPSLGKGSLQLPGVTKIKKDPNVKSISMSTNNTQPFNADVRY